MKEICISIPRRLAMRAVTDDAKTDPCQIIDPLELRAGTRRETDPIDFAPVDARELGLSLFSVFPYQARTELITIHALYHPLDNLTMEVPLTAQVRIRVDAHPLGMFVGALLGSFLAALLMVTLGATPQESQSLTALSRLVAGRCLRGAVAAVIVILITKTTTELRMPISIDVHDFYGGVLLGLFGEAVAAAIWKWLNTPSEEEAASSATPAPR
jgi:hypothetical protein